MAEAPGASIDGQIADLFKRCGDGDKRDAELASALAALEKRVTALEVSEPEKPPVEPEKPAPWPVFLLDLETGQRDEYTGKPFVATTGKYTIEVGEGEAADVARPVRFTLNGNAGSTENNIPIHAFGDNNPAPFVIGENVMEIRAGDGEPFTLKIRIEEAEAPNPPPIDPPTGDAIAKMQVGPWFPAVFNIEDPFINFIHPSYFLLEGGGMNGPQLIERGYVDKATGLPTGKPGVSFVTGGYFDVGSSNEYMPLRDGDWVFEVVGASATLKARNLRTDQQKQTGPSRLEFTRNAKDGKTPWNERFAISNVSGPIKALRLYRKEHETLVKAGKLYNPQFLDAVKGYGVIRTMDLQAANGAVIRSVDDLAAMDAAFWGSSDWSNATGEDWRRWPNPYQGMPIEAALRLGVEADAEIWFQAPITLGAPEPFWNFRPADDRADVWAARFADSVKPIAPQVLENPEWDRYADAFVAALIKSGYPADRPLYVSLANEVWNFSGHYFLTTTYAQRMGTGLRGYLPGFVENDARRAYGAMLSRLKLALDGALERAGREQNLEIVVEGQAAYIELTGLALQGAKAYMEKHNETWAEHAPSFGVSVASYWGYNDQLDSTGVDYNNLDALENLLINGSENILGTKANVVRLFKGAQSQAAPFGVKLLGAYEGGPHFGRPWRVDENGQREYLMTNEKYREFIWGERGGRVNYEINKALAEAFPGIILSNYALAGPADGQPWFEGPIGANNPYANSWDKLIEELRQ